ncbi:MAG: MarR family transcriptional regulator [Proteobacteria bacterium]|nr:MarR family transcriptional regulator [Pseudomonadota bacterium]
MYTKLREKLLPLDAISGAQAAMARLFEVDVADKTDYDDPTLRLLVGIRLAPQDVIRAVDISEQMQKSTSHISRLIDRAESKGLLERRADPSDRRAQQIALTELGKQEIDAYVPHSMTLLDEAIFATLSSDEISLLIDLLSRVETASRQLISKREGQTG